MSGGDTPWKGFVFRSLATLREDPTVDVPRELDLALRGFGGHRSSGVRGGRGGRDRRRGVRDKLGDKGGAGRRGGGRPGRPLAKPRAGFEPVERERWFALAPGPIGAFLRHVAGSLEGR